MAERVHNPASIESILVGTDLSEAARTAFDWAVELGRIVGAKLRIVHASSPGADTGEARSGLEELVAAAAEAGVEACPDVREGKPWRVLAETAATEHADLIVVGARGRTTVLPLLLGHTADRLIRIATSPVMCVHPADARHVPGPRTVVAATDLSDEGNAAATFAARLAGEFGAEARLVLVHIEQTPPFYESAAPASAAAHDVPDITAKRLERLEQIAAAMRASGLQVETVVRPGYAPTAIEEEAESHGADLIVIGARGESALEAMFIGSVAERVLHRAARPVILVPG